MITRETKLSCSNASWAVILVGSKFERTTLADLTDAYYDHNNPNPPLCLARQKRKKPRQLLLDNFPCAGLRNARKDQVEGNMLAGSV